MRTRAVLVVVLLAACLGLPAGPGHAAYVSNVTGFASATNGIALGADGNYWVAEPVADSVARVSPSGAVLGHYPVGDNPTSVAAGPAGRIWVTVTDSDRLAVLDTSSASPVATFVDTPSTCGPAGIVDGGNGRMYFSMPADGGCADPSRISSVAGSGGAAAPPLDLPGTATFDLAVSGGKLFAPDLDGDAVRRLTLAPTPASEATLAAPGGPNGITVDASGALWMTAFNTGAVFRFLPTAAGPLTPITPTGGTLISAFGIAAAADGSVYVTGADSRQVLRVSAGGTAFAFFDTPVDSRPWQIATTADGDLLITDQNTPRVLRFSDTVPRATGTAVSSGTRTKVSAVVHPGGNDTQVVFDYGTTKKYGETTAVTTLARSAGATTVTQALKGLTAGKTYHVRVRATNALGVTTGADIAVKVPARPGAAVLQTKTASGGRTGIKTLVVTGLKKGDQVSLRCQGGGCTAKASTPQPLKAKKAGSLSLSTLVKGLVLSPGAKLTVTAKLGKKGRTTTVYTMVKGKKPKQTTR